MKSFEHPTGCHRRPQGETSVGTLKGLPSRCKALKRFDSNRPSESLLFMGTYGEKFKPGPAVNRTTLTCIFHVDRNIVLRGRSLTSDKEDSNSRVKTLSFQHTTISATKLYRYSIPDAYMSLLNRGITISLLRWSSTNSYFPNGGWKFERLQFGGS